MGKMRKVQKIKLEVKIDERGRLFEIFKEELNKGQVYIFTCKEYGVVRGNHYHKHKKEVFCLIQGSIKLELYNIKTKKTTYHYLNCDKAIEKVIIPSNVVHTVINTGINEAIILAYVNEKFNKKKTDTYYL